MKPKKGLTIGWCVNRARRYISKYGICLLVWDVRGAKKFPDPHQLRRKLESMIEDLNSKFSDYFPENDLVIRDKLEKGFCGVYAGDCSWAGINNAEIIREIIKYQKEKYPDIVLWWGVAKDGWDKSKGIPWR